MKTTIFDVDVEQVTAQVIEDPEWQRFDEYQGKILSNVRLFEILTVPGAEFQMVNIAAGGHFAMHTSPDVAFCQVVRGRGTLVLPEEQMIAYQAPELFVFLPGSLHEWRDIHEDTLLAVCLVKRD